jgi:ribosomal protein L37AE/L43A
MTQTPDLNTSDPEHWSHKGSNYDGTDCENCKRERVLIYENGRRICEKCNWDQDSGDYAVHHERIG